MSLFYVAQNKTYKKESEGQYLWSPQKTKDGKNNRGYINMSKVKKGDIIFHGAKQNTYAISIAKCDCYPCERPLELTKEGEKPLWNEIGYRIDSDYIILEKALEMKPLIDWFKKNHKDDSAFTKEGKCKEIYLSNLNIDHAKYIFNNIFNIQTDEEIKNKLKSIREYILQEGVSEYDDSEIDLINQIVEDTSDSTIMPTWNGRKEEQEFINPIGNGNPKPKRNPKRAANALKIANYWCEYNKNDRIFERKNGIRYTEPHHLIPISKYRDFQYSLDVEENIVSLCSHCHNLLHYGKPDEKKTILMKLFNSRKEALKEAGLELNDFEDLMKYYK